MAPRIPIVKVELVDGTGTYVSTVDASGALLVNGTITPISAAVATRTSVAAAVADTALLAADPTRLGATVYNDSTSLLYVGYGATAVSTTNYSVQVPPYWYLEIPSELAACAIRGYWAAANGSARVTVG
jgi:hypothetical protein